MRTCVPLFAGVALIASIGAEAQGFQVLYDTHVYNADYPAQPLISTTDGGCVVPWNDASGQGLWKADANGNALWKKKFSAMSEFRARMPDGGLVMYDGYDGAFNTCACDSDTATFKFRLTRLGANGDQLWTKELFFQRIGPPAPDLSILQLSTDTSGRIFVQGELGSFSNAAVALASLDSNGNVIWSNLFRDPDYFSLMWSDYRTLSADGSGGCFFFYQDAQPSKAICICHVDQYGEIDWAKKFNYPGLTYYMYACTSALSNGHFILGGGMEGNSLLMSVSAEGTCDWTSTYYCGDTEGLGQVSTLSNGDLVTLLLPISGHLILVHLSPNGAVINASTFVWTTVGDFTYSAFPYVWDARGTTIDLLTDFARHRPAPDDPLRATALMALGPQFDGCLLTPSSVPRSSQFPDITDRVFEVPPGFTAFTTDTTFADSSLAVPTTWELCDLLNSIPTLSPARGLFRVINSIVGPGEGIIVETTDRATVAAFDASGRRMTTDVPLGVGRSTISTGSWPPGVYLLRAVDKNGAVLGHAKVVVE